MSETLGKLSCCASSASWFKNCGRPGDPNFEHTWTEGFKACKHAAKASLSTTTTTVANDRRIAVVQSPVQAVLVPMITTVAAYDRITDLQIQATPTDASGLLCPKCAVINKSDKLSCCARTASWYSNCGRTGDTNFEHTWNEGLEACKHAERLPSKVTHVLSNQIVTSQDVSASALSAHENAHAVFAADFRSNNQISYIVILTNVLLILLLSLRVMVTP